MAQSVQNFLAHAAEKAAPEMITALMRLPEDKRNWKPAPPSRAAADLVAECALLNESTANIIISRTSPPDFDIARYESDKAELAQDSERLQSLLHENTTKVAAAIRSVPDADLNAQVQMPWGPMTVEELMTYPYWNMSYHLGQINYIASLLGCLK